MEGARWKTPDGRWSIEGTRLNPVDGRHLLTVDGTNSMNSINPTNSTDTESYRASSSDDSCDGLQ